MPSCDSVCPFSRACAWLTCPTRRVPFFSTTLPFCLTSSCVRACTSSPGLLCFASREVASVASILVPSEIFAAVFPGLEFADTDDDFDAEPLPETCAPEVAEFVCIEDCDCADAPACPETAVCADALHVPSSPTATNDRMYFIKMKSSYPSSPDLSPRPEPQIQCV